jgi:hypothetical protein
MLVATEASSAEGPRSLYISQRWMPLVLSIKGGAACARACRGLGVGAAADQASPLGWQRSCVLPCVASCTAGDCNAILDLTPARPLKCPDPLCMPAAAVAALGGRFSLAALPTPGAGAGALPGWYVEYSLRQPCLRLEAVLPPS